jgi:hypothetical protein
MHRILCAHTARYPLWALDDLYKLVHQASMGSEHAYIDEVQARDWLTREFASLGRGPEEVLIDPISPDGKLVRVHLRPFVRLQLDGELLLKAFVRTSKEFLGSASQLLEYAEIAADLARAGVLRFNYSDVTQYISRMKAAGFPSIHHSPAYVAAYRPAYRVVAQHELPVEIRAAA